MPIVSKKACVRERRRIGRELEAKRRFPVRQKFECGNSKGDRNAEEIPLCRHWEGVTGSSSVAQMWNGRSHREPNINLASTGMSTTLSM